MRSQEYIIKSAEAENFIQRHRVHKVNMRTKGHYENSSVRLVSHQVQQTYVSTKDYTLDYSVLSMIAWIG